jgi:hypothetical protein
MQSVWITGGPNQSQNAVLCYHTQELGPRIGRNYARSICLMVDDYIEGRPLEVDGDVYLNLSNGLYIYSISDDSITKLWGEIDEEGGE